MTRRHLLSVRLLLLLLVLLEQPDTVVVRRYGRMVPGPDGRECSRRTAATGAAVGRRPLPLLVVAVLLLLFQLLLVYPAAVRKVLVVVHLVRLLGRLGRHRGVMGHRPPAGHRTGPVPGAPRFRERAKGHVRRPGAWVRWHAGLGPGPALVPDDHRVHDGQVGVTGPAPLFVVRRRRRQRGRRQLQRRRRRR